MPAQTVPMQLISGAVPGSTTTIMRAVSVKPASERWLGGRRGGMPLILLGFVLSVIFWGIDAVWVGVGGVRFNLPLAVGPS